MEAVPAPSASVPEMTVESSAPPTTMPTTTPTTMPTTTVADVTTTVPGEFPYWTDVCTERAGDPGASFGFDEPLGRFTTLAAAPTLDLVMPQVMTSAGPYGSIAGSSTIPGGVLVAVYPPDAWPAADEMLASSSLVAVNHDGTVRWRRCFDEFETRAVAVTAGALQPTTAWVIGTAWNEPLELLGIDLVTGTDVPFPLDVSALAQRGDGSRYLVFGTAYGGRPFTAADQLTMFDTLDGSSGLVPVPPAWIGGEGGWVQVLDADPLDDEVVLADDFPIAGETTSVYVDGQWTDAPAVRRDVLPPQITESFGAPFELRLFDGAGDLIWAVPDFHSVGREGFHWAVADSVILAMRCTSWDQDGFCGWVDDQPPQEELVGFDIQTGAELWTSTGYRAVPIVAGDMGIISDVTGELGTLDDGYVLVDLRSGERIDPEADRWPSGSFAEECCGGYVYTHVERSGGAVIATDGEHVRVWYPPGFTMPTVSVDLMG
jgi:hypothetical protein